MRKNLISRFAGGMNGVNGCGGTLWNRWGETFWDVAILTGIVADF